jgi:hypothetical protein
VKRLRWDTEARVSAAIFAGEVIFFAIGAWHYAL